MHPYLYFLDSRSACFQKRIVESLLIIACLGLFGGACNSGTVVSNSGEPNANGAAPAPVTDGGGSPTPGVKLPPSVVPTTPVGPIGQSPHTAVGEKQEMPGSLPITRSSAKPALTPAPDPFPARPTPSVVMAEGKIVQQWQAPADAAQTANPVKDRPDSAKLGQMLYMQKCNDCHGKEGKGNGWMGQNLKRDGKPLLPTNLASRMVQANTDGELFWKITNGRSPMPSHRVRFEDEQRWQIVSFLRTLKP